MSPGDAPWYVDNILCVIREFEHGEMDVEGLQSALEACAATLDNSTKEVIDALRVIDADLETIRFTMSTEEQPTAARVRLGELKKVISASRLGE